MQPLCMLYLATRGPVRLRSGVELIRDINPG